MTTLETYPLATCSSCINWQRINARLAKDDDRAQAVCTIHNAVRYGSEHCIAFVRQKP